jgi:hypothetical protein
VIGSEREYTCDVYCSFSQPQVLVSTSGFAYQGPSHTFPALNVSRKLQFRFCSRVLSEENTECNELLIVAFSFLLFRCNHGCLTSICVSCHQGYVSWGLCVVDAVSLVSTGAEAQQALGVREGPHRRALESELHRVPHEIHGRAQPDEDIHAGALFISEISCHIAFFQLAVFFF